MITNKKVGSIVLIIKVILLCLFLIMGCSGVIVQAVNMNTQPLTPKPPNRHKVAFLVHPRMNISADISRMSRLLGCIPNKIYQALFKKFDLPVLSMGKLSYADQPEIDAGSLLLLPISPHELLKGGRRVQEKLNAAIDRACELGAKTVGLGALTATASAGGAMFAHRKDIGVTNGNAFTAAMTFLGIQRLLALCPPYARIALVGATSSIGRCLSQLVASNTEHDVLLVGPNLNKLHILQERLGKGRAQVSTCMDKVRSADLVVLLTGTPNTLLQSEHLKQGAIVLDDTQPRNTRPALLHIRPDVRIIDGALVSVPSLNHTGCLGLPKGVAFACLAETLLLGLARQTGHFSLGAPSVEQAQHMLNLARRFSHLGFGLAPMHSFGHPVHLDLPARPMTSRWVAA